MMTHLWGLCDALAAAVTAAHPSWTVAVLLDPQTLAKTHPADLVGVELHLGPLAFTTDRGDEEGRSKVRVEEELTIALRMRTRRLDSDTETLARAKSLLVDEALTIAMRRQGFVVAGNLEATFQSLDGFHDIASLREDTLISILVELKFRMLWRTTPA